MNRPVFAAGMALAAAISFSGAADSAPAPADALDLRNWAVEQQPGGCVPVPLRAA